MQKVGSKCKQRRLSNKINNSKALSIPETYFGIVNKNQHQRPHGMDNTNVSSSVRQINWQNKLTKISELLPRKMTKFCIFSTFINSLKLQDKWTPSNNTCVIQEINTLFQTTVEQKGRWFPDYEYNKISRVENIPDPRGKKSFPTILSSTEDFPELCRAQTLKSITEKC